MVAISRAPGDMKFGQMLRELRVGAGLTQEALAERAGIPLNTIRNHEQGQRLPGFRAAAKLAKALGVSLDVLAKCDEVSEDEEPDPAPPSKGRKRPIG